MIPIRRRDRKDSTSPSLKQGGAHLTDLCPEDKSKIGELVKKLASETKLRQESESRFSKEKQSVEDKLRDME